MSRSGPSSLRQLTLPLGFVALAAWVIGAGTLRLALPAEQGDLAMSLTGALALLLFGSVVLSLLLVCHVQRSRESAIEGEQSRRNRLIVDAAADAILTFNHEGRIESFNSAATRMFGYSAEEVIGQNISKLIVTSDSDSVGSTMRKAVQTGAVRILGHSTAFEGKHKLGHAIPIELGVSKVLDEDRRLYIQIIRDLTERKQIESDLRIARDQAESANQAKGRFLAGVSHEVRTPLNGILGLTNLLLEERLEAQQKEYLELIRSSSETLLALINDLLDFSKLEATRMLLESVPFELRLSLDPTLKTLAVRAKQKGLNFTWHIEPDVPAWLIGDSLRLQQVLLNLAGNAIKFTPRGEVSVRLDVAARSNHEVVLHGVVRDTGIGIPLDKQEVIFEEFVQVESSRTRQAGGTGLGLTITAKLVGLMGGRIDLESEPGKGSLFHFTVRLGIPESPGETLSSTDSNPSLEATFLARKLLVAEDNPVNRVLLDLILQKRQHVVTYVTTGNEVVAACSAQLFDLILMDVQLPEKDGFEATQLIQAHYEQQGHRPPIVALTAFASEEDRSRCLQAGMTAYMAKPVQPNELLRVIDDLLKASGTCPARPDSIT